MVSVRGTLSLKDILTDCAVNSVPFLEGRLCQVCAAAASCRLGAAVCLRHSSRGLCQNISEAAGGPSCSCSFDYIYISPTICYFCQEIEDVLRKEMAAHKDYRLVFCGHSMGGAVSAMCVAMLRDKARRVSKSKGWRGAIALRFLRN